MHDCSQQLLYAEFGCKIRTRNLQYLARRADREAKTFHAKFDAKLGAKFGANCLKPDYLEFHTFSHRQIYRGPVQEFLSQAVLCIWQSLCHEGHDCSLSRNGMYAEAQMFFKEARAWSVKEKGSTRMCSVLELGLSIRCMLRREVCVHSLLDRLEHLLCI